MDAVNRLAVMQRAMAWINDTQPTAAIERMAWIVKGQSIIAELGGLAAPLAAETPAEVKQKEATYTAKLEAIRDYMSSDQYQVVRSSNKATFGDIVNGLYATIMAMPKTYETQNEEDPTALLHYFSSGSDWWITEKDMIDGVTQATGFACLNGDWQNAEMGYIGVAALLATNKVELDFHFDPVPLSEIRKNEGAQTNGVERPKETVDGVVREQMTNDQKAQMFAFTEGVTKGKRQKENRAASNRLSELMGYGLSEISSEMPMVLTVEDQVLLSRYSGNGGGLTDTSGKKGSDYEYYTPLPIAQAMWGLLAEYGVNGGSALDPSGGTGIFNATAPKNMMMDSVELDFTSGNINKLLHESATNRVTVSNFETVAANTPDDAYDVVTTNVPFSSQVAARGDNWKDDPMYQSETLDAYFLLRSIDKIRAGGLGAFIVPTRYVDGKENANISLRIRTQLKAEFLGAWRLPNKVFNNAGTDIATDIIIFRKYSKDTRAAIDTLYQGDGIATLYESRVLDESIIDGHYFRDEGRHFVIGEFQAKDKSKVRDVDCYITDESVANIAKLIRKFPDSRVNLELIGGVIVDTPQYDEGDIVVRHGQTWQMTDGEWKPLASRDVNPTMDSLRNVYATARTAYYMNGGSNLSEASDYVNSENPNDIPQWIGTIMRDLRKITAARASSLLPLLMLAYAVQEGIEQNGLQNGYDYTTGTYGDVSYGMAANTKMYKAATKAKELGADNKAVMARGLVVYDPTYDSSDVNASPFSLAWRGLNETVDTDAIIEGLNDRNKYERMRYTTKDPRGVPVERMIELDPNFDVHTNSDFCLSDDGLYVLHADDYFIGNVAVLQNKLLAAINATDDPALKSKLSRQLALSQNRFTPIDTSRMSFDLLSRYVKLDMKAKFLRQYVNGDLELTYDGDTPKIDVPKPLVLKFATDPWWRKEYITRMVGRYVTSGGAVAVTVKNLTTEQKNALLDEVAAAVKQANAQFAAWIKSQPDFVAELQRQATSPENLNFDITDDTEPLVIDGFDPSRTIDGFTLNPYQNAEIRRMARRFSGITGFDVGLGKTFTALATVQHMLNLGLSKKTVFVVPNAVLSNWRKEAATAYPDGMDDCLFVGLNYNDKKGKYQVNSKDYDRDIALILNNTHRKIFMTYEAFGRIPMMESTLAGYEEYIGMVDGSFSGDEMTRAKSERNKARLSNMTAGAAKGSAQFFEMLGIDKVVVDEFHAFKNAKTPDTFKGAKYLSNPKEAARALDMNAKLWYIRDGSVHDDGVMALTATPITNSPLEIYSMLSLAEGEAAINRGMMGIKGADAFLETFAEVEDQPYEGIDGAMLSGRVFTGLKNLDILKGVLHTIANIRTAAEEKLPIPDANIEAKPIAIDDTTKIMLNFLKAARNQEGVIKLVTDDMEDYAKRFGLTRQLEQLMSGNSYTIRNPLALCNEMANLSVEGKNSLLRLSRYEFADNQQDLAKTVADQFNKKNIKVEESTLSVVVADADIIKNMVDAESGTRTVTFTARARLDGSFIEITTNDYVAQKTLNDLADKAGLGLDPELSPKVLAMLDNFKAEQAKPRHKGHAKQIIFCDNKSMHIRIKAALIKQCGMQASKITIINGTEIKNPIQLQDVSDGFNGDGEDNRYEVIIANKKAEVGLNLQKGTQAIHHLTIGWTPDSLHQRNGRGVRQGNVLEFVTIYYYDQQGTFDEYKRNLVGKKSSWIDSVMSRGKTQSNRVDIAGGLETADYEALIAATGNAAAVTAIEDARRQRDAENRQRAVDERGKILRNFMAKTIRSLNMSPEQKAAEVHKDFFTQAMQVRNRLNETAQQVNKGDSDPVKQARREAQLRQYEGELSQMSDYIQPDMELLGLPSLTDYLSKISEDAVGSRWMRAYKENPKGFAASLAAERYGKAVAGKPDNVMAEAVKVRIESEQQIVANSAVEFRLLHPELSEEQAMNVATGNAMLTAKGIYAAAGYIGELDTSDLSNNLNTRYCLFLPPKDSGLQVVRAYRDNGTYTENASNDSSPQATINLLVNAYAPDEPEYQDALNRIADSDMEKEAHYGADLFYAFENKNLLAGYFPELQGRFKDVSDNATKFYNVLSYAPKDVSFQHYTVFEKGISRDGLGYNTRLRDITLDEISSSYGTDSVIYAVTSDYLTKGYQLERGDRDIFFNAKGAQVEERQTSGRHAKRLEWFVTYFKAVKPVLSEKDLQSVAIRDISSLLDEFSSLVVSDVEPEAEESKNMDELNLWLIQQIGRGCPFVEQSFFRMETAGTVEYIKNQRLYMFYKIEAAYNAAVQRLRDDATRERESAVDKYAVDGLICARCDDPSNSYRYFMVLNAKTQALGFYAKRRESSALPVGGKMLWEMTLPVAAWTDYVTEYPQQATTFTLSEPFVTELKSTRK